MWDYVAWSRDGEPLELALDRDRKWNWEMGMAGVLGIWWGEVKEKTSPAHI